MRSFCQDRLGANIGKAALKNDDRFLRFDKASLLDTAATATNCQ
eukprot:COSAG06_NODE_7198_length_2587_cov_3.098071_4_plen_44_part_00